METAALMSDRLLAAGFEIEVHESTAVYADAESMAGADLIVQSVTMAEISESEVAGLRHAVEAGVGLAGWHGGIVDSFRSSPDYLQLVGGQFAAHPDSTEHPQGRERVPGVVRHRILPTAAAERHPIMEGIEEFEVVTEQYWMLADSYNDVLATTVQASGAGDPWNRPVESPTIWTRQWGAGRVFVCTLGHDLEVLGSEPVSTIMERGMMWAAR
ncbi:ThuA domain-containing protein [Microbacterium tumbae]